MNHSPFSNMQTPTVQVSAALEPVRNTLSSVWALTCADAGPVDAWVAQAGARLSPEQRDFNRLLFAAFGPALLADAGHADFLAYVDALAHRSVDHFQAQAAAALRAVQEPLPRAQAEALLAEPARLQGQIVFHLRAIWDEVLVPEWKRHAVTLNGMTSSINELIFSQPRWQKMSAFAALRFLLQTEPTDEQLAQLVGVQRMVLVWSPHLLGWCSRFGDGDALWVLRKFDPQLMRRDPLSRAEVLAPLAALTDDTRLRILELLIERGEQRAQELIAQLESSQGNVSRHLKQLVGAGFVSERRAGDANKIYAHDATGQRRLFFLLRQLLSATNAQSVMMNRDAELRLRDARAAAPEGLHDFVDQEGRITRWSSKLKDQQAMMGYLAQKFEPERGYSEREVNDLLRRWYLDADFVLVRRSIIDAGLLKRTRDGSRYWRD